MRATRSWRTCTRTPAAKSAALNRVGLFFGFGALFIPFAIGLLLRTAGLRAILLGAAGLCVLVAMANALPAYPPAKQAGGLSLAEAVRLVRDPLVLLLGFLLFFQSGNEFIVGGFTTTFLTSEVGMSVRAASYALAGYWAALMLTRAWLGRGRSPLTGGRLVLASAAASAVVTALLVTASGPPLAVAMVVALGAALAGIFPAVLGVAASRFPAHSGTVFGLLFTMALTGGMTLPWLTGQAAAAWGLRPALGLVVLQFLAVLALQSAVATDASGASAPELVIPRDSDWTGPEGSAVSASAPADPSSPSPDGAPRGDKVIAIGDRQPPVPARNDGGYSWTRTPVDRSQPLRRTTSQAKTAERTRPTPVVAPRAS